MHGATLVQLIAHRRRLVGAGLAILIGVGFMAMTMLFGQVIDQSFRNSVGAEFSNVDFVVEAGATSLSADAIEGLEGIADVQPGASAWIEIQARGRTAGAMTAETPDPGALRDALVLSTGRLPESAGEVTLGRDVARQLRMETGETVTIMVPPGTGGDGQYVAREFTVVGIWTGEGRYGPDEFGAFLGEEDHALVADGTWISTLYVVMEPGADAARVGDNLLAVAGPGAIVATAGQMIDAELEDWADGAALQKAGVNAFALLALVVAGIVVSNTFAILVAQRTRDIALFRCAGATAGQVRRMVLTEAIVAGAAASIAGVAGAVAVTNLALKVIGARFDYASVPASVGPSPAIVAMPLLAGCLLAVVAAWGPARTAARIDPLRALRVAHSPVGAGQRPGPVRIGLSALFLLGGAIFLLGGAAVSYGGSREMGLAIGMLGGLATFLGVLAGASVLMPATVAGFGRIVSRFGGVPARVAASNGVRNPRRTTATTVALVIGVTLVTMMSVGAESLKATMFGEIDVQTPWDIDVSNAGGSDSSLAFAAFAREASQVDGVTASVSLSRLEVEVPARREEETIFAEALVADPEALAAVWRDADSIAGFGPGAVLIPGWLADLAGVDDGGTITLLVGGQQVQLDAVTTGSFESLVIAEPDVAGIASLPPAGEFWFRLDDDDTDANEVIDGIYDIADEHEVPIALGGMSDYRETLTDALDALLYVITALLGVAVLIAVIGVGNTLSLSVIERTRESALLRALGFTRRQLRQSLAVEGVLLAAIGSLVGIVLGVAFGWIGAITVIGNAWPVELELPLLRIGLIVLVAMACGLLASVLPARRAAQADPVVALADS